MDSFKTTATIAPDGSVTIERIPFPAGDQVEVTVTRAGLADPAKYPLWGTVLRYDNPTEPVAEEDWEALH